MIFSDAVLDQKKQHRIVVLSIAFKIAEFHGFPLHPLGLVMFVVNVLRFRFIFTQNLQSVNAMFFNKELCYSTIGFRKHNKYSSLSN